MAIIQPQTFAVGVANDGLVPNDHFKIENGTRFAGIHLLMDMWGASHLNDLNYLDQAIKNAVEVSGATLLHTHLHHFTPFGGISGVAVLAESHISVHTWPEHGFAAFDIFMCGDAEPGLGAKSLQESLLPSRIELIKHRRGVLDKLNFPD